MNTHEIVVRQLTLRGVFFESLVVREPYHLEGGHLDFLKWIYPDTTRALTKVCSAGRIVNNAVTLKISQMDDCSTYKRRFLGGASRSGSVKIVPAIVSCQISRGCPPRPSTNTVLESKHVPRYLEKPAADPLASSLELISTLMRLKRSAV